MERSGRGEEVTSRQVSGGGAGVAGRRAGGWGQGGRPTAHSTLALEGPATLRTSLPGAWTRRRSLRPPESSPLGGRPEPGLGDL